MGCGAGKPAVEVSTFSYGNMFCGSGHETAPIGPVTDEDGYQVAAVSFYSPVPLTPIRRRPPKAASSAAAERGVALQRFAAECRLHDETVQIHSEMNTHDRIAEWQRDVEHLRNLREPPTDDDGGASAGSARTESLASIAAQPEANSYADALAKTTESVEEPLRGDTRNQKPSWARQLREGIMNPKPPEYRRLAGDSTTFTASMEETLSASMRSSAHEQRESPGPFATRAVPFTGFGELDGTIDEVAGQ